MLVDRIELLETTIRTPNEKTGRLLGADYLRSAFKGLASEARLAQRVAIARLLDDEPDIHIDPLTGIAEPQDTP